MNFDHWSHDFVCINNDRSYIEMEFYDIAWLDDIAWLEKNMTRSVD